MMKINMISTENAPQAIGPYSQAVKAGNLLFVSGQIPLRADGEMVSGGIEEQTHQVFKNLQAILNASGISFNHVLKVTVYLADMGQFNTVNSIYASYFGDHKPARATVEVSQLPKGSFVEIDLICSTEVESY